MRRLLLPALLVVLLSGCTGASGDDAAPSTTDTAAYSVLDPCPQQPDEPASGAQTLPAERLSEADEIVQRFDRDLIARLLSTT